MSKLLEFKSLGGEIKDIDTTKRVVTGYLSAFGNEDSYGDTIEKGAFTKSINDRKEKIYFLNQHNWSQPHGKFKVLMEDNKGLYFESEPLVNTSYSNDLLKLYDAGIINEHSIGFQTIKSEWSKDGDTRVLKEIKLYEGSNVTRGANPETPFTGLKSLTVEVLNNEAKLIMKAMKNGTFTDETFVLLEMALNKLQTDAFALGQKSLKKQEPLDNTLKFIEPIEDIKAIQDFIKNI